MALLLLLDEQPPVDELTDVGEVSRSEPAKDEVVDEEEDDSEDDDERDEEQVEDVDEVESLAREMLARVVSPQLGSTSRARLVIWVVKLSRLDCCLGCWCWCWCWCW